MPPRVAVLSFVSVRIGGPGEHRRGAFHRAGLWRAGARHKRSDGSFVRSELKTCGGRQQPREFTLPRRDALGTLSTGDLSVSDSSFGPDVPQVLFFAGLSCDAGSLLRYSRPVLIIGTGYLLVTVGIFALIGWGTGLCVGIGSTIFFGVACSLSSRQLMTEHLDRVHQEKTMHGRLLQGIALYQDFLAILAFTILTAFQRTLVDLDAVAQDINATTAANTTSAARRAGDASDATASNGTDYAGRSPWVPTNVWHDRFILGDEIGKALGIVALFAVVFALLNRYVLESLFRFFTTDGEMLFIGTMAYNFGAAALFYQAGVSPMVGSFFAGFSLSQLPSRIQIQNKVSAHRPACCTAARNNKCR